MPLQNAFGDIALDATLTDATQKTQLVDGGGTVADVTAGNALKVDGSGVTQPVSGTVTANAGTGTMAVSGPLTDAQLRATAVPVSGTVTATGPLTDTQLRATAVPVSGPLTDTELRATAVPVSASSLPLPTGAATETTLAAVDAKLGGTIAVSGPLTDTQLRATPVPVSGTVTANAGTGTMAVSAASLPLPTGAATSALQGGGLPAALVGGRLDVVIGAGTVAATQSGSWTVTASNTAGDVAHDGVDSGNPVKIGAVARTTAYPAAVAAADRVNVLADAYGRLVAVHSLRDLRDSQQTKITSSTAETTIVTADATYKNDLYSLQIANTSATATKVTIRSVTAGSARFVYIIPAGDMRGFTVPACDGAKQASVNTAWTIQCTTSVADIEITALFTKNL